MPGVATGRISPEPREELLLLPPAFYERTVAAVVKDTDAPTGQPQSAPAQDPVKAKREERCRLATMASTYLKSRPAFAYRDSSLWLEWIGFNMKTGDPIPRSCKVRIVDDSYFDKHRRHPWGGNQGRALVYLAHWVRTGKMPLTAEDWDRWCGPPVRLGNEAFLLAIKEHVYGGAA